MNKKYLFPVVEFKQELKEEILSGKQPVLLYGMGAAAKEKIELFQKMGIKIICGLDMNHQLWGSKIQDVLICSPEAYHNTSIPVIICSESCYYEICIQLRKWNVENILPYFFYHSGDSYEYQEFNQFVKDANKTALFNRAVKRDIDKEFLVIDNVDLPITEKCSLRCKDCSNLMQYFKKPANASIELSLSALDKLLNSVDEVNELHILGGEPFLTKDFPEYVRQACKYSNVGAVVIYSNATIIPQAEALDCLKHEKVVVRLSNYGPLSRRLGELTALFEEEQIFYSVVDCFEWKECSSFEFRNREPGQLQQIYKECCVEGFLTLKDQFLFGCPFAASAFSLRALPKETEEWIDTSGLDIKSLRRAVKDFQKKKYLKACNYCSGRPQGVVDIPAALQASEPLPYKSYY